MTGRPTPTLNVSTAGPPAGAPPVSATGSLRNRPHGARRRAAPGLFIANPDNSDSDGSSSSPVRVSPARSSPVRSSPKAGSPIVHSTAPSNLGRSASSSSRPTPIGSAGPTPSQPPHPQQHHPPTPPVDVGPPSAQPGTSPAATGFTSGTASPNIPRIVPGQLPSQPSAPYASPPLPGVEQRPLPPQPPPQPERHRRAFTSPVVEHPGQSLHLEPRPPHGSVREAPSSPSRALPPLPPTRASTAPSGSSNLSATSTNNQLPPYPAVSPPLQTPSTLASNSTTSLNGTLAHRVASPDESLNGTRNRSSSMQKTFLQVTTDNEQFFVVDITGISSSDGIRERIFSRLRFRDDDYESLSIYRTDIGEQPDQNALGPTALLQLCQSLGDAKANLKFLVVQTSVPGSASASVVPPQPNNDPFRPQPHPRVPPIVTDVTPAPPYTPHPDTGRHSNGSSMSGSGEAMERSGGSRTSIAGMDDEAQIARVQGRLGSGSGSSRSPMTDPPTATSGTFNQQALYVPPPSHPGSVSSPSLLLSDNQNDDEGTLRPTQRSGSGSHAGPSNAAAGSSSSGGLGLNIGPVTDPTMDPATAELIRMIQLQDQEDLKRIRAREEADKRLAMQEQESEREVWQMMQQFQIEDHQRQQQQGDEASPAATEQERFRRESDSAATYHAPGQHTQPSRDALERSAQFAAERRERRQMFSNLDHGGISSNWTHIPEDGGRRTPFGRRQSDGPQPPYSRQSYTSPPSFSTEVPSGSHTNTGTFNRTTGYLPTTYENQTFDPLDPRITPIAGQPPPAGSGRRPSRPYITTQLDDRRHPQLRSNTGPPTATRQHSTGAQWNGIPATPIASEPHTYSHGQDGRYPDAPQTARGIVQFPSPQPRPPWAGPDTTSPPRHGEKAGSPGSHRRSTVFEQAPDYMSVPGYGSRPRSGSDAAPFFDAGRDSATAMSYSHRGSDASWAGRDASETASLAGTTYSDATTIHAPTGDESTVRGADADDWRNPLQNMINGGGAGAIQNVQRVLGNQADGDDEATLFFKPMRPPGGAKAQGSNGNRRPLSSSDSESGDEGTSIQRARSFAASTRDNDWRVRPDPEQLYDNLQEFFPKIDLDAPVVDPAAISTPSTPSSDSPRNTTEIHRQPPPQHPSRQQTGGSTHVTPAAAAPERAPTQNPARAAVAAGVSMFAAAFNRSENRRSIRNVADLRRRSIQRNREANEVRGGINAVLAPPMENAVGVRRSSSMWGHRVVEVTPSGGNLPPVVPETPESPSSDGRPMTLNWVKGELIGKGSYGRVYLALNVTTGDMMAVKQVEQLAGEEGHDPRQTSMIEALKGEISLLKDMYHPNIVAYLGCETSPEYLSIFLEYVPGGTIAAIYRTPNQARFEEELVKFFTGQILEGLAYLHNKNIWHRDLKGDNILVDANGVCKISDFGISKQTADAYDSFNNATVMKGSVFWMAPEVVSKQGERSYSGKVDIWSLGCVVLEMWTGSRPWCNLNDQMAAIFALFSGNKPGLPDDVHLSEVAYEFLYSKCLAQHPESRPTAIDLLQHPFVTERNDAWTFPDSEIGKAVARRGAKKARAQKTMRSASASTGAV